MLTISQQNYPLRVGRLGFCCPVFICIIMVSPFKQNINFTYLSAQLNYSIKRLTSPQVTPSKTLRTNMPRMVSVGLKFGFANIYLSRNAIK